MTENGFLAIVNEYCKKTGLEIEVAASLVNSNLKSKLANDALDLNLLKESET